MGRKLGRFKHCLASCNKLRRAAHFIELRLPVARDIAVLTLTILAIYIAYWDYLKIDVQIAITAPSSGSAVLNREISIEGTISGGPYNGYEVHHKAPEDEQGRLVRTVQESGEQLSVPVFPISLTLTDDNGASRIGQHTITVTLKAGNRNVAQDHVFFNVIDCSLIMPREFTVDKPIHDIVDLRPDEKIQEYDFLYFIDGIQWTLDCLNPAHLEDEYHQLRVAAVARGSEEEVDSITTNFVVDNTAPIIQSLGLNDNAKVSGRLKLVPQICEPHLEKLELCVDDELVGKLEGQALQQGLNTESLCFTLENGWLTTDVLDESEPHTAGEEKRGPKDGWHEVLIKAFDVNGLCSKKSVRVWVDSTCPDLCWDLASNTPIPVLSAKGIWLGAITADPEAEITYHVEPPATIAQGEYLDTSECRPGSVHTVWANATDLAGNVESQVAYFVIEQSTPAWLNTIGRSVTRGITAAIAPISDVLGKMASEGMSIGIGTEVSSSLADENKLMWRGIFDFVFVEICPMWSRGFDENMTMGLGFRIPLDLGMGSESTSSLIQPVFGFGAAVTPNWRVLSSLDFGTEEIAETWVKLSLPAATSIPLSAQGNTALKVDAGPGCKLSYVQEFVREAEYLDGEVMGVKRFTQDSVKLEVTIDASISFLSRRWR